MQSHSFKIWYRNKGDYISTDKVLRQNKRNCTGHETGRYVVALFTGLCGLTRSVEEKTHSFLAPIVASMQRLPELRLYTLVDETSTHSHWPISYNGIPTDRYWLYPMLSRDRLSPCRAYSHLVKIVFQSASECYLSPTVCKRRCSKKLLQNFPGKAEGNLCILLNRQSFDNP